MSAALYGGGFLFTYNHLPPSYHPPLQSSHNKINREYYSLPKNGYTTQPTLPRRIIDAYYYLSNNSPLLFQLLLFLNFILSITVIQLAFLFVFFVVEMVLLLTYSQRVLTSKECLSLLIINFNYCFDKVELRLALLLI